MKRNPFYKQGQILCLNSLRSQKVQTRGYLCKRVKRFNFNSITQTNLFACSVGRSFYRLSETSPISHPGIQCLNWITSDVADTSNPVVTSEVTQCPPSLLQKTDSLVNYTNAGIPSSVECYAKRSALSKTSTDPRTMRCCFDTTNKGLILDHVLANGFNTYM